MNANPDTTLHLYAIFTAFIKLSSGQIGLKSKLFHIPIMGVYRASLYEYFGASDCRCLTGSYIHAHTPQSDTFQK